MLPSPNGGELNEQWNVKAATSLIPTKYSVTILRQHCWLFVTLAAYLINYISKWTTFVVGSTHCKQNANNKIQSNMVSITHRSAVELLGAEIDW